MARLKNVQDDAQLPVDDSVDNQATEKPAKKQNLGFNKKYEEWKVDVRPVFDDKNQLVDHEFEKIKLIKTVKIEPRMALRLNDQSVNSKIRYYVVD